jgi:PIN domain nuclease of toxin-antitoxin system
MRLLLDSHVLLWWAEIQPNRLRPDIRSAIDNAAFVSVSAASVWELEIKRQARRLDVGAFRWQMLSSRDVAILPIDTDDALAAARQPLLHRDPFDRMIVAQAMRREFTLVTADAALARYAVPTLGA